MLDVARCCLNKCGLRPHRPPSRPHRPLTRDSSDALGHVGKGIAERLTEQLTDTRSSWCAVRRCTRLEGLERLQARPRLKGTTPVTQHAAPAPWLLPLLVLAHDAVGFGGGDPVGCLPPTSRAWGRVGVEVGVTVGASGRVRGGVPAGIGRGLLVAQLDGRSFHGLPWASMDFIHAQVG